MTRYCPYCGRAIPGNHHVCNCEGQRYGQAVRSSKCDFCGVWISGRFTYCKNCVQCSSCGKRFNSLQEGYNGQCKDCLITSCENCGTEIQIGTLYCNICKCILCDNLKLYGKNYCHDCKCSDYHCDNAREEGGYYCSFHRQ